MGHLRDDEVRLLLAHLRRHVGEGERLAEIEDLLRSDEADEYVRGPELFEFFPQVDEELSIRGERWLLRIIPHAHLRMVQRGLSLRSAAEAFRGYMEYCYAENQVISTGPVKIIDTRARRSAPVTWRLDVDEVEDDGGRSHVVTVVIGRTAADEDMETVTL
jgi:hypothetical protein